MNDLQYDVPLDGAPKFRVDAVWRDTVFEVSIDSRDLRRLRSSLFELAQVLCDRRRRVVLILDEPQISDDRLLEEWELIQKMFLPDMLMRLCWVIRHEGYEDQVFGNLLGEESKMIEEVAETIRRESPQPGRRPSEAFFDILRVLLIHWFRQAGSLTSKQLGEFTGFTYPTIARSLERLEPELHRHSDRRVELRALPKQAWAQLVAQSGKVRASQGFTDPSGRPRPPEILLERLRELGRPDIAVGGVSGARHHLPGLDLVGTPRLDLVFHRPPSVRNPIDPAATVCTLDPALRPAERGEPVQVMIHTLYRPEAFFVSGSSCENVWADKVECLLDLHEARLEPQALEFLERLTPPPNS